MLLDDISLSLSLLPSLQARRKETRRRIRGIRNSFRKWYSSGCIKIKQTKEKERIFSLSTRKNRNRKSKYPPNHRFQPRYFDVVRIKSLCNTRLRIPRFSRVGVQ